MLDYFSQRKQAVNSCLQSFLERKKQEMEKGIPWGEDVLERLKSFSANGKMVRGGLVLLAHRMYDGQAEEAACCTAAAMELLQSAFLIHDDIMDQDSLRRGEKTVFQQYVETGGQKGFSEARRFGESMATCVGDVAFFLAFELLNDLPVDSEIRRQVAGLTLRENFKVGLGQMQDVYFGFLPGTVSEKEILTVFRCKTATYTFILPLLAGAVLAGRRESQLNSLRQFGETMGVLFQVRDDDLGLFGESDELGKPVGNDIRQGKKTLYHLYLMNAGDEQEKQRLRSIFGNPQAELEDIEWVRQRVKAHGIQNRLQNTARELAGQACRQLAELTFPRESCRQVLREVIDYSLKRNK